MTESMEPLELADKWTNLEVHDELSEVLVRIEGRRYAHLQRTHVVALRDWLNEWIEEDA